MLQHKGFEWSWSANFGVRYRAERRIVAGSGQSSPLVDTSCSGSLDRFALLSNTEPTQVLPGREEIFKPAVIAHDAVDHASAGAHDLRGQQDDCVEKAPKLHLDQLDSSSSIGQEQAEPRLEVPGQRGHHHIGPVAQQIVHRHAHGVDSVFELLDHVLLITAPLGQTDDLLRVVIDAVGNVEKVTDLVEEDLLALLHADVLAHDDEPIGPGTFARADIRSR